MKKKPDPSKLVIDDVPTAPATKVKLYEKIPPARAKLILEDPNELEKLKYQLEAEKVG